MPRWSSDPDDKIAVGRGKLRKVVGSGVWHFHFKNDRGKWVSLSTGHHDRRGAVQWAEALSMQLTQTEFGFALPPRLKGEDRIGPALDQWLEYQKDQNRPYTHRSYRSIAKKFKKFIETRRNVKRLGDVTTDVILEFRRWALAKGNSRVTIDNNLIALRSFFNWCVAKRMAAANPLSQSRHGVRLFYDEASPRIDTYTSQEFRKIIEAVQASDKPIFKLLGTTGFRCSEAAMLEWSDVDRGHNIIRIRRKTTVDGVAFVPKDRTDRVVPISRELGEALDTLAGGEPEPSGYVIRLPSVLIRPHYFERLYLGKLKDIAEATGIPKAKLTLHNFRRFFVSQCADCNIPMPTVMDWVGHDEMKMVMHYYRLRDDSAQRAMERFHTA